MLVRELAGGGGSFFCVSFFRFSLLHFPRVCIVTFLVVWELEL